MSEIQVPEDLEAIEARIAQLVCEGDWAEMNGERLEDADYEGAAERGRQRRQELHEEADRISREAGLGSIFTDGEALEKYGETPRPE